MLDVAQNLTYSKEASSSPSLKIKFEFFKRSWGQLFPEVVHEEMNLLR